LTFTSPMVIIGCILFCLWIFINGKQTKKFNISSND
jgi:hypothetical protein